MAQDAIKTITVDLGAKIFKDKLPFDEKFMISGKMPKGQEGVCLIIEKNDDKKENRGFEKKIKLYEDCKSKSYTLYTLGKTKKKNSEINIFVDSVTPSKNDVFQIKGDSKIHIVKKYVSNIITLSEPIKKEIVGNTKITLWKPPIIKDNTSIGAIETKYRIRRNNTRKRGSFPNNTRKI